MGILTKIFGAETGGTEELQSVSGTVTISNSIYKNGQYSCQLTSAATAAVINVPLYSSGVSNTGNNYITGFAIRFQSLAPAAAYDMAGIYNAGTMPDWLLRINTNGDLQIYNATPALVSTISAPFVINNWYYIEVFYNKSGTGSLQIYIDGKLEATVASSNFTAPAGAQNLFILQTSFSVGHNLWIDDMYHQTGCTNATERYGHRFAISKSYGNTTGTSTPNVGNTFTSGTGANISNVPANNTTTAVYNAGLSGAITANSGTSAGPATDSLLPQNALFVGSQYIIRSLRSTGSATTHQHLIGKNGSTTGYTISLTTSYQVFTRIDTDTINPATDYITHGFGGTGGAQSITVSELWAMIAYVGRRRIICV